LSESACCSEVAAMYLNGAGFMALACKDQTSVAPSTNVACKV
jgi:hypothetical protein